MFKLTVILTIDNEDIFAVTSYLFIVLYYYITVSNVTILMKIIHTWLSCLIIV